MSWRPGGSGERGERAVVFGDRMNRINRISGLTGLGEGDGAGGYGEREGLSLDLRGRERLGPRMARIGTKGELVVE
jgi:hypothetical protein